jgi:hypothetical protein
VQGETRRGGGGGGGGGGPSGEGVRGWQGSSSGRWRDYGEGERECEE